MFAFPVFGNPPRSGKYAVAAEERQAGMLRQLAELQKRIIEARDSDLFKSVLEAQAKFRAYSLSNSMLIAMQRPNATRIAGFRKWTELGRFVKMGESGILILCPSVRKREEFVKDPLTGEHQVDPATGMKVVREREYVVGYHNGYVFDISQTEGKPLPDLAIRGHGGAESLGKLEKAAATLGIPVNLEPLEMSLGGFTDGKTITLNSKMSAGQRAGILAHELSHVLLKHADKHDPRSLIETEAEASTYIVAQKLGIERKSDFYLANWNNPTALAESMEKIVGVAREILDLAEDGGEGEACEISPASADAAAPNPAGGWLDPETGVVVPFPVIIVERVNTMQPHESMPAQDFNATIHDAIENIERAEENPKRRGKNPNLRWVPSAKVYFDRDTNPKNPGWVIEWDNGTALLREAAIHDPANEDEYLDMDSDPHASMKILKKAAFHALRHNGIIAGEIEVREENPSSIKRGSIVRVSGEPYDYVVLEAEDERGPMSRILVRALGTGMKIAPTERVERRFVTLAASSNGLISSAKARIGQHFLGKPGSVRRQLAKRAIGFAGKHVVADNVVKLRKIEKAKVYFDQDSDPKNPGWVVEWGQGTAILEEAAYVDPKNEDKWLDVAADAHAKESDVLHLARMTLKFNGVVAKEIDIRSENPLDFNAQVHQVIDLLDGKMPEMNPKHRNPSAHTPGPWMFDGNTILTPAGDIIAEMRQRGRLTGGRIESSGTVTAGQMKANTLLVAHAPEMLSVLEEANQTLLELEEEEETMGMPSPLRQRIEAVISKATGK